MSLPLILLLLLISFLALLFKKRKAGVLFFIAGLALSWLIGCGVLPEQLLNGLQTQRPMTRPEWKSSNVIVLLGAGLVRWPNTDKVTSGIFGYSRVSEAARLYRSCSEPAPGQNIEQFIEPKSIKKRECRILASGGDPGKLGALESEVMLRDLTGLGVPFADVILESKSNNTFQNAQFSSEILKARPFDKIILVTSGMHARRSRAYFSRFVDKVEVAPSDHLVAIQSTLPLAYNFTVMDFALHEYAGLLRFRIYNQFGWNPERPKPGNP